MNVGFMVMNNLQVPNEDEPKEEVDKFINSLTNAQLEKIMNFAQNAPALTHVHTYKCEKCNEENNITLKGLQDFF